jgi:phosphoenolpyruvate synthase/pyruvate phosphate dikinase
MPKFAVIKDNLVVNVIIADTQEIAEAITNEFCINSETAGVGFTYDPEIGNFLELLVEAEETPAEEVPAEEVPAEETPAE